MITIDKTEKQILINLYIDGKMGKCGSLTLKQRQQVLNGLLNKGLITNACQLTRTGKLISMPFADNECVFDIPNGGRKLILE